MKSSIKAIDELGVDELGADELGVDELGADELGADELRVAGDLSVVPPAMRPGHQPR